MGIESALIQSNSKPEDYKLNGINCSTIEDMTIFRLAAKESKKEHLVRNDDPIHIVLDECDDALLNQITLYKLVAETGLSESEAKTKKALPNGFIPWLINLSTFLLFVISMLSQGKVWDEEEDVEQFRLFLNKEIHERFHGDIEKQNLLMAASNTQLLQWIHASCTAAMMVENKHFILQPIKEKDEAGNEITKKIACVPLIRSTPKTGSIFTEGVHPALQTQLECRT